MLKAMHCPEAHIISANSGRNVRALQSAVLRSELEGSTPVSAVTGVTHL